MQRNKRTIEDKTMQLKSCLPNGVLQAFFSLLVFFLIVDSSNLVQALFLNLYLNYYPI